MKTSKGIAIHKELGQALRSKPEILQAFQQMRPSCQIEYSEWVASAAKPETRQRRIASVLKKTAEWGARHPEKKASPQKVSTLKRDIHPMPAFVRKALLSNGLMDKYNARPPYQRNDYIGWISRAARDVTKQKRLNQMLDELKRGGVYMNMVWNTSKPVAP